MRRMEWRSRASYHSNGRKGSCEFVLDREMSSLLRRNLKCMKPCSMGVPRVILLP
jgi:hypothetical protein